MGRNEICFCGSGLKKKRCHGDINDNSLVANMLKIYKALDEEIKDKVKCKCRTNCNKCCYDYFYISEEEFLVIMYYIERHFKKEMIEEIFYKSYDYMKYLKQNYEDEYNKLNNITYGFVESQNYDINKFIPRIMKTEKGCIFLKEGKCSIYEVRPIVCRSFGTLNKKFKCPDVFVEKDEFDYKIVEDLMSKRIKSEYELILKQQYIEREYPISDFVFSLYDTYKLSGKLGMAIKKDKVEYAKNKIKLNRR